MSTAARASMRDLPEYPPGLPTFVGERWRQRWKVWWCRRRRTAGRAKEEGTQDKESPEVSRRLGGPSRGSRAGGPHIDAPRCGERDEGQDEAKSCREAMLRRFWWRALFTSTLFACCSVPANACGIGGACWIRSPSARDLYSAVGRHNGGSLRWAAGAYHSSRISASAACISPR